MRMVSGVVGMLMPGSLGRRAAFIGGRLIGLFILIVVVIMIVAARMAGHAAMMRGFGISPFKRMRRSGKPECGQDERNHHRKSDDGAKRRPMDSNLHAFRS